MEIAVPDAAARLGVSEPRVRQLLASGDLAGRRLGRSWLVSDESVARLQHNRRSARAAAGSAAGLGAA